MYPAGTLVNETKGFWANSRFTMLENGKGLHEIYGEKVLLNPKPIKISREENFRRAMAKNPTCPAPILEKFFLVEGAPEGWDIRLHSALFHDVIEAWQSAGLVVLPENHRAIAAGARGGAPMWGIAATLESKRGISDDLLCALTASGLTVADNKVNDLNLVRWLLQAGQPYGWRVTRTV